MGHLIIDVGRKPNIDLLQKPFYCTTGDESVKRPASKSTMVSTACGIGGQVSRIFKMVCKLSSFSPDMARYTCAWLAQAFQCWVFFGDSSSSYARVAQGDASLAQS